MSASGDPQRGVHRAAGLDVDSSRRELEARGWRVYVLPPAITDRRSFFDGVREALPLDPHLYGHDSWDALSDSVWGGLDAAGADRVAIIWPGSATMSATAPDDAELARSVLGDVSASLADPEATVGEPKEVAVLLA